MDEHHKKVEAVLFAVGREITTERLASLCSLDVAQVTEIMQHLMQEHNSQDHSLQIIQKENGWKLTVRDQFLPLVTNIVSSTELEQSMMQTLAVIAWKYPIVQSDVVKIRGAKAYEHMAQLEELGYVAKEKYGRTYKLKLTTKFFNYFDLPSEEAKQAFLKQIPAAVLQEAENIEKESDEVERLIDKEKKEKVAKSEIEQAMQEVKN